MKNIFLIIMVLLFSVLLVFSILVYSSTSNAAVKNRIVRLQNKPVLYGQGDYDDDDDTSVTSGVYQDVYGNTTDKASLTSAVTKFQDDSPVVYITIDDGPDPRSTPEYLKILKENGVKATFFMIGNKVQKYPGLAKEVASEGHSIGNHSYTHNYSTLYRNIENFTTEIQKTEDSIFSATGERSKIFRPPGGSTSIHNIALINKLNELGYAYFDWNVSSADSDPKGVTKSDVIYNIEHESQNLKRVFVLMHDNPSRSASREALPELISWFKNKGYQFGTLDNNVQPIHLKKF